MLKFPLSMFLAGASSSNPARSSIVGTHRFSVQRDDGTYDIVGESAIRATAEAFHIVIDLTVTRNGRPFFERRWIASEPRQKL